MADRKTEVISLTPDELEDLIRRVIKEELATQKDNSQLDNETSMYTQKEAASFLRVTEVTLHHWKKKGKINYKRIGHRILFSKADLLNAPI